MISTAGGAILFYAACFASGFLLCFPFGAASLEMLRLSLAGRPRPAFLVAAGAALVSAGWALLSFLGVRSMARFMESPKVEFVVLTAGAVLVGGLSFSAYRDSRRTSAEEITPGDPALSSRGFGQLVKGVLLGLVNPQTIASWVVILSFFRKAGLHVPPAASAGLPFFLAVLSGYGLFFAMVIRLARRLPFLRSSRARSNTRKAVAGLMLLLAIVLGIAAVRVAVR